MGRKYRLQSTPPAVLIIQEMKAALSGQYKHIIPGKLKLVQPTQHDKSSSTSEPVQGTAQSNCSGTAAGSSAGTDGQTGVQGLLPHRGPWLTLVQAWGRLARRIRESLRDKVKAEIGKLLDRI